MPRSAAGANFRRWASRKGWGYTRFDHHFNRGWRVRMVRGESVDYFLRKNFPVGEVFSFENAYPAGKSAIHRHITGVDLVVSVPRAMLAGSGYGAAPRTYAPVEVEDPEFRAHWRVSSESRASAPLVQDLLTAGFRQRLCALDLPRSMRPDLVFEDHCPLLAIPGEMNAETIDPAARLVRDLAQHLPNSVGAGRIRPAAPEPRPGSGTGAR